MAPDATQGSRAFEVLYGHCVADEMPVDEAIGPRRTNTVTVAELTAFLETRAHWRALSVDDFVVSLTERAPVDDTFLLTFDDGYRDNLTHLLPVLETFGVPVLIFVTTGFVGRESWPVEAKLAVILAACQRLRTPGGGDHACADEGTKRALYDRLRVKLRGWTGGRRDRYVSELASLNGITLGVPDGLFLDWGDVRALDRHPLVTIGAHTHSHPWLKRLGPSAAFAEIRRSKEILESELGHPVVDFAYPYGANHWLTRRLVSQAGFRAAFATRERAIRSREDRNRFRIPRLDLRGVIGTDVVASVGAMA